MKYLFVQPLGGLCNRMRVITGSAVLAKELNKELVVIWTRDKSLNCKYSDLFVAPPFKVIETQLSSLKQRFLWHLIIRILRYRLLKDEWIVENARGKRIEEWIGLINNDNLFIYSNLDIVLFGDYSIFKPKPSLLSAINNVTLPDNTIGIHLRRTDNEKAIRFSPTKLFLDKVKDELRFNPNQKYYLATDDLAEERLFVETFGDNIIIYNKNSLDRNAPVAIKEALVDLYNLSCCSKIYGSYYSSFSDVAAVWGGIQKTVLKID